MSVNETSMSIPNALPAGHRFNEFEIKDVIGGGGFGIVYRAWDHLLERTIAIKEYMPASLVMRNEDLTLSLRSDRHQKLFTAGLNSFIQEARLLARFNHPGLLHVLRFWEENGTAYMGTLYYSGMTLKAWQHCYPDAINEAWIRQLLPPLFGAINAIHHAGYLHRDIALDNIQIQDNQLPVLLDFGSARKEIGNLSDETEIMLKPGFAPIEQYSEESDREQGLWTDIYALGAVLHTLIIGHPPAVSVVRCIEDHYQLLAELAPAGYSRPLLAAVDRALALKPEERPQSIEEFALLFDVPVSDVQELITVITPSPRAWPDSAAVAGQQTKNDTPSSPNPLTARTLRRLSPGRWLLSALTLAAVAGLAIFIYVDNEKPAVSRSYSGNVSAIGQSMALVYLKLNPDEKLVVNGKPVAVQPDHQSGYTLLNLAKGQYQIDIHQQDGVHTQILKIDHPGTWLVNPGLPVPH